jgi:hypothetical protein
MVECLRTKQKTLRLKGNILLALQTLPWVNNTIHSVKAFLQWLS